MLQQTRVVQALPYYLKFIRRFPSVFSLAKANEKEVLRLWQGLGYYTRARNLRACARSVVKAHQGRFPDTYQELMKLPGVGSYTAAAIASFCFHEPVAVVDGNVFRVLARAFGLDRDIAVPANKQYFSQLANELIRHARPDEFNQAIMEFGATFCVPQNPDCEACIFKSSCVAKARGMQHVWPVKSKRSKTRTRHFYYFVFRIGNKILLKERTGQDIWKGLYDFYLVETARKVKWEEALPADASLRKLERIGKVGKASRIYRHLLTHQVIEARFIPVDLKKNTDFPEKQKQNGGRFYSPQAIDRLPKPVLISRFLADSAGNQ